jgi:hypothetical protein
MKNEGGMGTVKPQYKWLIYSVFLAMFDYNYLNNLNFYNKSDKIKILRI